MGNLVYIKTVDKYDDILSKNNKILPKFLKGIVFMYKNMFNIITKKKIEDNSLWILPIEEKYSINKMNNILNKLAKYQENIYVISDDLVSKNLYKLMDEKNILYLKGKGIKKYLSIKILEYINKIHNEELSSNEVTILVNNVSEFNIYLIEKLSKIVKSIKIVSSNIYKFKNLEEKLYNEHGIGLQFSNSYKKSLSKSKIIINLDFNSIDINEYEVFNKAIIINCADEDVKIKSKLYNGIVINSCDIKFKKDIRDKFRKINIYHRYNNLLLYESNIYKEKNFNKIFEALDEDKVRVISLIGNNGDINKSEFKNIFKKLDK